MRLLYVLSGSTIGGVETGLLSLLRHLDPRRVQASVVTFTPEPAGRLFRQQGVRHHTARSKDRLGFLRGLIRRKKIQLVQSCWAAMDGALAARQTGVPHLWYIGGELEPSLTDPSFSTLAPLRLALAHLGGEVVLPSKTLRREFRDLPASKIHVIPHGMEIPALTRRKTRRLTSSVVAMVGNFYPAKRHLDFLKTAVWIRKTVPETRFVIAGRITGNSPEARRASRRYKKQIQQSIRRLHLKNQVTLTRFSPSRQADWFGRIDLLLSPSREGLGWALLEAGAAGVPIVSVKEGGAAEILQDHRSGRLVPYGEPRAMAKAAVQILRQPALARRLGQGARRRILARYSARDRAWRFNRLYRAILRK